VLQFGSRAQNQKSQNRIFTMYKKVLITGGSGLIGTRLTTMLQQRSYDVVHLTRGESNADVQSFSWDPARQSIDEHALDGVGVVIHLAGASIAGKRWTPGYKRQILASRIDSTRLLFNTIQRRAGSLHAFISASAIGFYGSGEKTKPLDEDDKPGQDFLAGVVQKWESEVRAIATLGPRVSLVRTGIVLSAEGGALSEMMRPIRWGVGAPLGTGQQIVSWVHIDDLCRAYIFLMENRLSGTFNVAAPVPVTNEQLTKAIAEQLHKPLWLPNIPGFVLKGVLGEMADAVLTGSAVSPQKIVGEGFSFEYSDIGSALRGLI
jgi:uncharacterized protein (TIGR01777 family)